MFGSFPEKKIVHGGLECGIIGSLYPGLEMVAIGPDVRGNHSPQEKLNVESMEKSYNFLLSLLKNL
ncbi:MAG: hypothetical protein K9M56_04685 [Victivallales bacterium]|nr:hypothetical protein [Victivallales bacterium]